MTFTVEVVGICAGGDHVRMTVMVSGGAKKTVVLSKNDIQQDIGAEPEEMVGILVRSAIKESGLTNWGQIKTMLEARTFKI